jgi:hypothetical protein
MQATRLAEISSQRALYTPRLLAVRSHLLCDQAYGASETTTITHTSMMNHAATLKLKNEMNLNTPLFADVMRDFPSPSSWLHVIKVALI